MQGSGEALEPDVDELRDRSSGGADDRQNATAVLDVRDDLIAANCASFRFFPPLPERRVDRYVRLGKVACIAGTLRPNVCVDQGSKRPGLISMYHVHEEL